MTFFPFELSYSVVISSETKDQLFLAEICLVISSTILFKTAKITPWHSFVILILRFYVRFIFPYLRPFSTLTLESEQLEEEEEVVLTSDGESETASEDENEFIGHFSNTNCESFVLYR